MAFVPWNSQPLQVWARKHAPGQSITLGGHQTHYIERGEGRPVILIHGFFYDTYMWHHNIETLATQFKVYAIDLWGFGYSPREPLDYGYSLYSQQLLEFMDALRIQKASLIGQSIGGGAIVKFATSHRDRIDRAILVAPAGMPNPLPLMARIANFPLVGEVMYGLQSDFMRKLALRGTSEAMLTMLRKRFFDTLLGDVQSLRDSDLPTLIVWGQEDQSVPVERGQTMHAILRGSRLHIIPDAGHCPHDEQSESFNQLALAYLSERLEAA